MADSFFIDVFTVIPGALYNFVYNMYFFVFKYRLFSNSSTLVEYDNPFLGTSVSYTVPKIPGISWLLSAITDLFGFPSGITFFELMTGILFIIVLIYAAFKFLKPL